MRRIMAATLMAAILLLAGCSSGSEASGPTGTEGKAVLTSDPFPASWIGRWDCTKSEWEGFIKKGDTLEFFDYKNKMLHSWFNDAGDHENKVYCWAVYSAENKELSVYYDEGMKNESNAKYEVVKQTETQITLNATGYGSEIILEKQ